MTDKQFINFFITILGTLVTISIVIFIIASNLASMDNTLDMNMLRNVTERVKPIGQVNIEGITPVADMQAPAKSETANAPTPVTAVDGTVDIKTTYENVCAACHASGVTNAPIMGDKAAWEPRIAMGIEALYNSALKGKGIMPAKGGRPDISDEVIKQTVDYMVEAVR